MGNEPQEGGGNGEQNVGPKQVQGEWNDVQYPVNVSQAENSFQTVMCDGIAHIFRQPRSKQPREFIYVSLISRKWRKVGMVLFQMIGTRARRVVFLIGRGTHSSKHVDCTYETRAAGDHVRRQTTVIDGVEQVRRLAVQQFTQIDEAVVCGPVHRIVAFVVAIFDCGSRCKQKVGKSNVTTLNSTQKWSETEVVSDVNIGSSIQQSECRADKAADRCPV